MAKPHLILPTLALLISCHSPAARTLHNPGHLSTPSDAFRWAQVTPEEQRTISLGSVKKSLAAADVLAAGTPESRRVEALLATLDAVFRAHYAAQLAAIPRPWAFVFRSSEPTAFSAPFPICFQVPLRFRPEAGGASTNAAAITSAGEVFNASQLPCRSATRPEDLAAIVAGFNSEHGTCTLTLTESGLQTSAGCPVHPSLSGFRTANRFVFTATSNAISVSTAMLDLLQDDDSLAAALAHELGHYYRAHINRGDEHYNFYHFVGSHLPDPDAARLGLRVKELYDYPILPSVPGQSLHSALFPFLLRLQTDLERKCAGYSCATACGTFARDANLARELAGSFPDDPLPEQAQAAFHALEASFAACAAQIPISIRSPFTAPQSPFEIMRGQALSLAFASLPPMVRGPAREDEKRHPVSGDTLLALIQGLSANLTALDAERVRVFREQADRQLGFYTMEQEADELALEILAAAGRAPESAIAMLFLLGEELGRSAETHAGREIGLAECQTLRAAAWRDPSGQPVFIPVGRHDDPHHSICYRVFNMDREIAAHGWGG